jgi:hypothetical protein
MQWAAAPPTSAALQGGSNHIDIGSESNHGDIMHHEYPAVNARISW